jgi:glycosyltransferase involved in cell wall biosynthesis
MNIIIIYPNAFPVAGSATNRVVHLAKALIETSNFVEVLCVRPTEEKSNIINHAVRGNHDGITFIYTANTVIWPKSKKSKIYYILKGLINAILIIYKRNKENKIHVIVSSSYSKFTFNIIYSIYCKVLRIKFISTLDEYPWVILHKNNYNIMYRWLYINYYYKLFDGCIIMTKTLLHYYRDKVKNKAKLLHFPMSVEIDRFVNIKQNMKRKNRYIAYSGWDVDNYNIDGIDILIKAFKQISERYKDINLYLIGKFNEDRLAQINHLNLGRRVVFTGPVHRDNIPEYFQSATVLALARPNSLQAQGGFPTKLGEYLASGTPVIVTKVGEIPHYLVDGESAFLADPGDVESFVSKLEYVLSNPKIAKQVGLNGQKVALKEFNYKSHLDILSRFMMILEKN